MNGQKKYEWLVEMTETRTDGRTNETIPNLLGKVATCMAKEFRLHFLKTFFKWRTWAKVPTKQLKIAFMDTHL